MFIASLNVYACTYKALISEHELNANVCSSYFTVNLLSVE